MAEPVKLGLLVDSKWAVFLNTIKTIMDLIFFILVFTGEAMGYLVFTMYIYHITFPLLNQENDDQAVAPNISVLKRSCP